MIETTRQRLATLLLLFFLGALGAIGFAVTSNRGESGKPAADQPPSGNGTVVGAGPSASPSPGKPGNAGPSGVFSISGSVDQLVPGHPATLPLTITNPNPWPIQVLTIDASVGAPDGSPCPASTLSVGTYTYQAGAPKVSAPARGTTTMSIQVQLADSLTVDQSGCPGSTFPLTFTGTATMAAR